jgi:hypothetical protein
MARKINQAPSTQITSFLTDDIIYVARPSGLSDHWIKGQKISAINPGEGDLQYFTGGNWQKTNGLLSWDGSSFTVNGVPVTVQDELVGGQAASAILQTPTVGEDGYVVSWDNTAGEFTLTPILESISLDQLSDVDLSGAADNDMLYRFGGQWVDTGGLLQWNGSKLSIAPATGTDYAFNITQTAGANTGLRVFNPTGSRVIQLYHNGGVARLDLMDNTAHINSLSVLALKSNSNIRYTHNVTVAGYTLSNSYLSPNTHAFDSHLSLAAVTMPTVDTAGWGRLVHNSADGLIYWIGELGEEYNLTAGVGFTVPLSLTVDDDSTEAQRQLEINNTGDGDAWTVFNTPTSSFGVGIDQSDNAFVITSADGNEIVFLSADEDIVRLAPDGKVTFSPYLINDATGDEVAFTIKTTIDKLTSGNYTGLLIDVTETSAPGTDNRLIDLKVGGTSLFIVNSTGKIGLGIEPIAGNKLVVHETSTGVQLRISTDANDDAILAFRTDSDGTTRQGRIGIDYSDDLLRINHGSAFDGVNNGIAISSNGNVGVGGTANTNAILDITSTTKAFMPPRMTTTQRDNISSPAAGMVIYNTSTNVLNFHNGTSWGAV